MKLKEELIKIVGAEYFSDDLEVLKQYSKDYSLVSPRMPTCVVKPKNAKEIQKIVKLANRLKMPIWLLSITATGRICHLMVPKH